MIETRSQVVSDADKLGEVLIIDDSDVVRKALAGRLRDAGIRTLEMPSPIGATRVILAHDVSVVVINVMTSGMRGDGLVKLFRGNRRFENLAVVLVSGESDVDIHRLQMEIGADAALPKKSLEDIVPAVQKAWTRRFRR